VRARERRVERYYDPTTDQFWSVDPEVAETGQPYAFTGDNPLNSTDPLGLSGGTTAYANYLLSQAKHRKYCKTHPAIRGHNCGGLLHEAVGTLDKLRHKAAAHKDTIIAGGGLLLGTAALFIPGAEPAGAELDEASLAAISTDSEVDITPALKLVKQSFSIGAVVSDAYSCGSNPGVASCTAAILGAGGLTVPGDLIDPVVAWDVAAAKYVYDNS
jgi:hypothetical protein